MRYHILVDHGAGEALPEADEAQRAPNVIGRADLPRVSVDFVAACRTVQLQDVAPPIPLNTPSASQLPLSLGLEES